MRWTIPCIVACWLLVAEAATAAAPAGRVNHAGLGEAACARCHPAERAVFAGPMGRRSSEAAFARRAFGRDGDAFFASACSGCHVRRCADCHGEGRAFTARPRDAACLECHRGDNVGWDYHGRAARADHERYQRGAVANGEHVLAMRPDLHQEAGLGCVDCHRVHGDRDGAIAARGCRECHPRVSPAVPEHAITAHLERMECWACHSAWASQEYGTFLVRPRTAAQRDQFGPLRSWSEWQKSAWARRQDAPPLGLDARGLVSPIRPRDVLFATDTKLGWENRRLAAEWRAFFPHTIRRGTTTCSGCHDTPRRFVLEPERDRIQRPDEDGLGLRSFWDRRGQRVVNGAFFPPDRYAAMNRKTPTYIREHLRRWQQILDRVAPSSAR